MMRFLGISLVVFTVCFFSSITFSSAAQEQLNVIYVSDFAYTLHGQPATSIVFGFDDENYYEFTLLDKNIRPNGAADTKTRTLSASATVGGENFVVISNKNSFASLVFEKYEEKQATFSFHVELIGSSTGKRMIQDGIVTITGDAFQNLKNKH
jgi:hypothetical protein